ncbi:division/cell wall cluster transcriptional repressor MraZ [Tropicimonas sp. IMCC6043]|uniref:division/cell wall cluster transcriptional repressor MraZ n=1 Tax=Tropicimonas sp. IMCC6043 TaxID=2510645 RepID=UPI00101DC9DA|nr:cell division/cell wall cluster transcriptional repressor MraZ [Tropicimonas sp. IMCC6043]RYH07650.1 cell division/cell wall cluster transcriptional repressor MraZ [Tropicimonas sp. IMCC6043]
MARVFRGQGRHKVDVKGRVSIPAPFRRVIEACDPDWTEGLQPNLVVHYGTASRMGYPYIECYTIAAADKFDEDIIEKDPGDPEREFLEDYFNAQSTPATVDDNGRLLLSKDIRDLIGLEGEALFVASGETFKIWKPETYESEMAPQMQSVRDRLGGANPKTLLKRRRS